MSWTVSSVDVNAMKRGVHIQLQVLSTLRLALTRFRESAQSALMEMDGALHQVERYLDERGRYWREEIVRRERAWEAARRALAACRSQAPQDARYGRVDCTREEEAVLQARVHLERARAALREVQNWKRLVSRQAQEYQQQKRRMQSVLSDTVPSGISWLHGQDLTLRGIPGRSCYSHAGYYSIGGVG